MDDVAYVKVYGECSTDRNFYRGKSFDLSAFDGSVVDYRGSDG